MQEWCCTHHGHRWISSISPPESPGDTGNYVLVAENFARASRCKAVETLTELNSSVVRSVRCSSVSTKNHAYWPFEGPSAHGLMQFHGL